jgi:succinate dehydrogenase / fumarate reductase membrane anchor subunit
MDSMDPGYRTPLRRARGLGAAKHGVEVWIAERVTSIALVPLVLWGVYSVVTIAGAGYDGAVDWLQNPINAVLLALLLGISFHHTEMGMRVIIEDYIHKTTTKFILLLLNSAVAWLFGALAIFAVLKVAVGGLGD